MAFSLSYHFPGFIVLGVDYFFGDPVHLHTSEEGFDRNAWMSKSKQQAKEAVPKWTKAVKDIYGRYRLYTKSFKLTSVV